jgi:hypothetical protein
MIALLRALAHGLVSSFRDRASLRLEIMALRHQLEALQRHNRGRVRLSLLDRAFWSLLYRFWSGCLDALVFVMPDTVVRWHRKGFRLYWTWKSRPRRRGRPEISAEVKALIGRMSRENPLWGAPRIHGELLKLGIGISAGHGLEVHGAASQAALAELADLPSEPRLLSGGRRFLRRSNPHLSHLVRLYHLASRAPPNRPRHRGERSFGIVMWPVTDTRRNRIHSSGVSIRLAMVLLMLAASWWSAQSHKFLWYTQNKKTLLWKSKNHYYARYFIF